MLLSRTTHTKHLCCALAQGPAMSGLRFGLVEPEPDHEPGTLRTAALHPAADCVLATCTRGSIFVWNAPHDLVHDTAHDRGVRQQLHRRLWLHLAGGGASGLGLRGVSVAAWCVNESPHGVLLASGKRVLFTRLPSPGTATEPVFLLCSHASGTAPRIALYHCSHSNASHNV